MMRFKLFLLVFISILLKGYSQHKIYEQFTSKSGLPSNTVYDMVQDEKGYMLFATDNGLSKFDGTSFTTFSITDGLPDNEILKLFKDSQNRIWLLGFNGEVGYLQNNLFHNRYNTPFLKELSFKNNIDIVHEDRLGNLWFYGRNNIIRCLMPNLKVLKSKHTVKSLFPKIFAETEDNDIYLMSNVPRNELQKLSMKNSTIEVQNSSINTFNISKLSKNTFNILRKNGFYTQKDSLGISFYTYFKKNIKGFNTFWPPKIHPESPNNYWVFSSFMGLYLVHKSSSSPRIIFQKKDLAASAYYKDNEGNEWISSINDGVLFFPKTNVKIIDFPKTNNLKIVYQSKDSHVYIGDYLGNLSFLDSSYKPKYLFNNSHTRFSKSIANRINSIVEYKNYLITIHNSDIRIYERKNNKLSGRYAILSIGTGKKGYVIDSSLYVACSNNLYKILLDSFIKHAKWSYKEHLYFDQKEDYKPNNLYKKIIWKNRSSSIFLDLQNTLWIGSNKGLFYLKNDSIINYTTPLEFTKCNITDIKEMANGTLLVATNGYGLGVIEKGVSYFIHDIGEETNPIINSITIEKDQHIWLATNTGTSQFTLKNKQLSLKERYTPLEGLSSKNIEALVVNDSLVYATSPKGLNIINRNKVSSSFLETIPIHINTISVNNISEDSFNTKALKHNQNDLYFSYTGISFKSGKHLKYRYRLSPWETEWITTTNREVRYSNLPSNTYTFEVIAVDNDGTMSVTPAQFDFTIKKAWYAYGSIKFLAICLAALLIWYFISNRINSIKIRSTYNEKIAVLKHQALLAQMNPHFIYNSLSSIQQFILSHNTDQAQKQLTRFASLIRRILDNSKKAFISLTDELGLIDSYLTLEQTRFDNRFTFSINSNVKEPDHVEIPPMIIQPIVENAVIHGISNLSTKKHGRIDITFTKKNEYIECCVIDNGIGINTAQKLKQKSSLKNNALALANIKERLNLYSTKATLTATELFENEIVIGTKVTVTIPIINYL